MLNTIRLEFLKLKGTILPLIVLVLPLLAVLLGYADARSVKNREMGWQLLYEGSEMVFSSFLFPITIILVIALIIRMEHLHENWKYIFSLPLKKSDVFFSKLSVSLGLIGLSALVYYTYLLIGGLLLKAADPQSISGIFSNVTRAFWVALPIVVIQYFLSLMVSNIGLPLALGTAFVLPTILVANSEKYWIFYPWAYPVVATSLYFKDNQFVSVLPLISTGMFLFITLITFFFFNRKEIT